MWPGPKLITCAGLRSADQIFYLRSFDVTAKFHLFEQLKDLMRSARVVKFLHQLVVARKSGQRGNERKVSGQPASWDGAQEDHPDGAVGLAPSQRFLAAAKGKAESWQARHRGVWKGHAVAGDRAAKVFATEDRMVEPQQIGNSCLAPKRGAQLMKDGREVTPPKSADH